MIAFSGVLISWLIRARNSALAEPDRCATTTALPQLLGHGLPALDLALEVDPRIEEPGVIDGHRGDVAQRRRGRDHSEPEHGRGGDVVGRRRQKAVGEGK
jgi:hypothetical protein